MSHHSVSPRAVRFRNQPPEAPPCRQIPGQPGDEAGARCGQRIGPHPKICDESCLSGGISHHDRPQSLNIAPHPRGPIELQEAVGYLVQRREPPLRGRYREKPPNGVRVSRV